jgi:hypothetical protein
MNTHNQELFAIVADGEVFHTMAIPSSIEETRRLIAGLNSDPKIINITGNEDILRYPDWKYDYQTKQFYRSSNTIFSEDDDYEVE